MCWDHFWVAGEGGSEFRWNTTISRNKSLFCTFSTVRSLLHFLSPTASKPLGFFPVNWWNSAPERGPVARPSGSIQCPNLLTAYPSFPSSSSSSFFSSSSSASSASPLHIVRWDGSAPRHKPRRGFSVQLKVDSILRLFSAADDILTLFGAICDWLGQYCDNPLKAKRVNTVYGCLIAGCQDYFNWWFYLSRQIWPILDWSSHR